MAKQAKQYVITCHNVNRNTTYVSQPMTIVEAVEYYAYTLEVGASWQHEKGNKKINRKPTTIKALIKNLDNAVNNAACNGYAGKYYTAEEV